MNVFKKAGDFLARSRWLKTAILVCWTLAFALALVMTLQSCGKLALVRSQIPIPPGTLAPLKYLKYAYRAPVGFDMLSAAEETGVSLAQLYEDGRRLGPGNAPRRQIGEAGNGRFAFVQGVLTFSASDNTDPRSNGRRYTLSLPAYPGRLWTLGSIAAFVLLTLAVAVFRKSFTPAVEYPPRRRRFAFLAAGTLQIGLFLLVTGARLWGSDVIDFPFLAVFALVLFLGLEVLMMYLTPIEAQAKLRFSMALVTAAVFLSCSAAVALFERNGADQHARWDTFMVNPDTNGYLASGAAGLSRRTPVYPLFLDLFYAGDRVASAPESMSADRVIYDPSSPLLQAARVQTLFLILCAAGLAFTAVLVIKSAFPAFTLLLLFILGSIGDMRSMLLSETIAQGLLMVVIALFLLYIWGGWRALIPLLAALVGVMVLTRPAAIFGGIFLLGMIVWACLQKQKNVWVYVGAGIVILGGVLAVEALPKIFTYKEVIPTKQYMTSTVSHGFYIAEPADLDVMPDDETKALLLRVIALREENKDYIIAHEGLEKGDLKVDVRALSSHYPDLAARELGFQVSDEQIYSMAKSLLRKRPVEHWLLVGKFALYTQQRVGTIPTLMPIAGLFGAAIFLLLGLIVLGGPAGFAGAVLLMAHFAHIAVFSYYGRPTVRYVMHTEFMVYLGAVILVVGLAQKTISARRSRTAQETKTAGSGNAE